MTGLTYRTDTDQILAYSETDLVGAITAINIVSNTFYWLKLSQNFILNSLYFFQCSAAKSFWIL